MCSKTFLKRISEEDGSAMVEAAFVYPILILLVFSVIFAGLRLQEDVRKDAALHEQEPPRQENLLREETLLRTVWMVRHET